jgi:cbb3-type cytochrome oxidase maturation protein
VDVGGGDVAQFDAGGGECVAAAAHCEERLIMEALYLLVPLSVGIVFAAIWVFFKMSDSGQFDDMEGPALRVLQDDDAGGEG